MRGGGRVVGLIMAVGGLILLLGFLVWGVTALASGDMTPGGLALGFFLGLVVVVPLIGIGLFVLRKGIQEEKELARVEKEKTILNMVLTQGQVTVQEIVVELQEPRDVVEDMIRDLVGKRLFSGAINWDKGILYSVESQALVANRKCPNCGGELEFAGKGLIVCPWCGSQVFLTKRAAAETEKASAPS